MDIFVRRYSCISQMGNTTNDGNGWITTGTAAGNRKLQNTSAHSEHSATNHRGDEAEQALVDANRELIARFEKKIRDAVGRVWGESSA